jgi:hypothetical protein
MLRPFFKVAGGDQALPKLGYLQVSYKQYQAMSFSNQSPSVNSRRQGTQKGMSIQLSRSRVGEPGQIGQDVGKGKLHNMNGF